jgi:hypothetical protein
MAPFSKKDASWRACSEMVQLLRFCYKILSAKRIRLVAIEPGSITAANDSGAGDRGAVPSDVQRISATAEICDLQPG